ncbi:MAG: N-acetylmuramoyl-L-alanine amidase [Salibacteraceae bacterium]|mgnify:CR=1 FL=1
MVLSKWKPLLSLSLLILLWGVSLPLAGQQNVRTFPIFGEKHEKVTIVDSSLAGVVFYVVSGHGGPDPGAVAELNGHTLCEDEYAYDISLRLARRLLSHDASVYLVVRDPDDGIRSQPYLECDKDEVCWKEQTIPLGQIPRLDQRVIAINNLYSKRKPTASRQIAVILHVDSRGTKERVDMFFYHDSRSKSGKKLALTMQRTIRAKYQKFQKGRGYTGKVVARDLHMLRETSPTAVYIELGNLRNPLDQKRFIVEKNRQAVADWLAEGMIAYLETLKRS